MALLWNRGVICTTDGLSVTGINGLCGKLYVGGRKAQSDAANPSVASVFRHKHLLHCLFA